MLHRARALLALACLATVGCSAKGPPFQAVVPPPGQAVVYVYRPSNSYEGSGVEFKIDVNGTRIGKLKNRGYLHATVPPGPTTVSSKTETTSTVPFTAEAGRSYYISAEVEMGILVGRPLLTMVPEETGQAAILTTRHSANPTHQVATSTD